MNSLYILNGFEFNSYILHSACYQLALLKKLQILALMTIIKTADLNSEIWYTLSTHTRPYLYIDLLRILPTTFTLYH